MDHLPERAIVPEVYLVAGNLRRQLSADLQEDADLGKIRAWEENTREELAHRTRGGEGRKTGLAALPQAKQTPEGSRESPTAPGHRQDPVSLAIPRTATISSLMTS